MMPDLLRAGFALALVIVLILVFAAAAKRLGQNAGVRSGKRLAVVESLSLDPRRRLVLVRRDGTEHLLLLGPGGDVVVERGLAVPAAQAAQAAPEDA